MSSLKKLASDTALYGISSILGRVLNYLLVPIYTKVFQAGEYGEIAILYAYVAFLNVLYTYGMETAYFRFAAKQKEQEQQIFNTSFTSLLFSSILLSAVICLLAPYLLNFLDYEHMPVDYIYWLATILAVDAVVAIPFARLRLQNRPLLFASARLLNIFINIALNLFFLVLCPALLKGEYSWLSWLRPLAEAVYDPSLGIGYVFLSNLIANLFYLIILLPVLIKVRISLNKEMWQQMVLYSYPLLFMGIAGVTNQLLALPMLKNLLPVDFYQNYDTEAAVGIFSACYKLSIFMNLAIQAFRFAAEPFFFSKASDKNSTELFSQVMHYFIIVCCFIFFAVTVNLHWITPIFLRNPIYWQGIEVVPVLLLAYLFYGVYLNLSIWFKLTDLTKYGTWFTGIGALLTIVLNILLIPVLGYMGAALSTLLVYFSMAAMCYYYGQKFYHIPYRVLSGLLYILLSAAAAYAVLALLPDNKWAGIATGVSVTLLYLLGIGYYERKKINMRL